jgi:hypothetical protein
MVVSALEPLEIYLESTVETGHPITAVAPAGSLVYAAGGSELSVIDVSARGNPLMAGSTALPGEAMSLSLIGQLLFSATGETGVSVFSCADPRRPRLILQVDTPGFAERVVALGRLIAVADGDFGVHFFLAPAP